MGALDDLLGINSTQTPVPVVPTPQVAQPVGRLGRVEIEGQIIRVFTRNAIPEILRIPGRRWAGYEGDFGVNNLPLSSDSLAVLERHDLSGLDLVRERLAARSSEEAAAEATRAQAVTASLAEHAEEVVLDGQSPEWTFRPYQSAGIDAMLSAAERVGGALNADQMGLGKTGQAVAAVAISGGRTLVVCPPAVRSNWEREIKRILPESSTTVLFGRTPHRIENADWVIVTYSVVSAWCDKLVAEGFANLVVDEAHAIKDPKSAQSQAVIKLSEVIS